MPKVTIGLPVYNDAAFLRPAIESILNQTYKDFQFLIVDDGSTDDTPNIINSYRDERIRLITHPTNLGRPAARNTVLANCDSEYLAWMDGDDVSMPRRIEYQVNFLDNNKNIDICCCGIQCFNQSDWTFSTYLTTEQVKAKILYSTVLAIPACCTRIMPIRNKKIFFRNNLPRVQDYAFWLDVVLVNNLKAVTLPEKLYKWRYFHRGNTSKFQAEAFKIIFDFLNIKYNDTLSFFYTDFSYSNYSKLPCYDVSTTLPFLEDIYSSVKEKDIVNFKIYDNETKVRLAKYMGTLPFKIFIVATQKHKIFFPFYSVIIIFFLRIVNFFFPKNSSRRLTIKKYIKYFDK